MPGSQCCGYIRKEFQLKHLGFANVHPARFSYSQWRIPLWVMVVYRFLLVAYCIGWLMYILNINEITTVNFNGVDLSIFAFLTMWTYVMLIIYLLMHFLETSLWNCHRGVGHCMRLNLENHRNMFCELHVHPSLWDPREYEYVNGHETEDDTVRIARNPNLHFLAKFVWVLYNIASVGSIMVMVVFWIAIYPYMNFSKLDMIINIQLHAIPSVIVFIETCVTAVPVRLLHYFYTLLYCIVYVVFTGILYAVDHQFILYPHILDWTEPARTAVVLLITAFVVLPIAQLFLFGIYKLRLFVFNVCNPEQL